VTSSKVNEILSVESTWTLFVLLLANSQFLSNGRREEKKTETINCKGEIANNEREG